MSRRAVLPPAVLLAAVLVAGAGSASAAPERAVDLPRLFAAELVEVRARSEVPVLLPQRMRSRFDRHVPGARSSRRAWALEIGAVRGCGGATACFIAEFTGRSGGRPQGRRTVKLFGGRTGYYRPLSCGASCSPPSVQWREAGAVYSIQANLGTRRTERRRLVRLANSAIRSGPR